MKRRKFITLLGGAAAWWPVRARAQEPGRTYRLGALIPVPRAAPAIVAFLDELRVQGFAEGQNLSIVADGFDVHRDQIEEKVAELVKAAPDAIISGGDPATSALQKATRTIPIVVITEDVVAAGFAASLARPGGNITGISLLSPELDGKRQEILIGAVPDARRIAAMADSNATPPHHLQTLQSAARSRGVELLTFSIGRPEEIISANDAAKASSAKALNFLASPLFSVPGTLTNRLVLDRIAVVRLPAIFQWPDTAEAGALAGYGPRFSEMYRQRARMLVKILRGSSPADIPVEQPVRFELVLNLKAAIAIGYEVPAELVLRADKLIE